MVTRIKWIDRRFNFDYPVGVFPCLIERLRGTAARLDELTRDLSPEILTRVPEHGWTIQGHVGHLWDVDILHTARLDQFLEGLTELKPADMSNARTEASDHNARPLVEVMQDFRCRRTALVNRLETLDEATVARAAHHPRLNKPMRLIDMVFFAAEHDDQHLASISELQRTFLG